MLNDCYLRSDLSTVETSDRLNLLSCFSKKWEKGLSHGQSFHTPMMLRMINQARAA